jgi:hypothetical protein
MMRVARGLADRLAAPGRCDRLRARCTAVTEPAIADGRRWQSLTAHRKGSTESRMPGLALERGRAAVNQFTLREAHAAACAHPRKLRSTAAALGTDRADPQ